MPAREKTNGARADSGESVADEYRGAFPNSRKVYVEAAGDGLRVPMREIGLSGGEPPLRVYDTAGPQSAACSARSIVVVSAAATRGPGGHVLPERTGLNHMV